MAAIAPTTKDLYLSENSVAYSCLSEAPTESIGVKNPISLPKVDYEKVAGTFGKKINRGNLSDIYQVNVKGVTPRVYKVVSKAHFQDGNEIRISKIASAVRVTPAFYSAFIVVNQQTSKSFVVIEMEDSGKSLGKWMDELSKNIKIEEKKSSTPVYQFTEKEKALQEAEKEIIDKMQALYGDEFATEEIDNPKKISVEEAVDQLYTSRETFYCQLFEKLKILADNHIAYEDPNAGNIMPNLDTEKGLQIIDFDTAELMSDVKTAARKTLASAYTFEHITQFRALSNPSEKSVQLLDWIKQHR